MKKFSILTVLAAVFFTGQTCAGKRAEIYDRALAKWNRESIRSYYIKVSYRAFTPQQGQWELEVKEGQVVRASFRGLWHDKYVKPAERFTVDSIYKTADAVKSGETDGPMVVRAEFSETVPYIKSVSRANNEKFKGNPVKDAGFSIVILEFEQR